MKKVFNTEKDKIDELDSMFNIFNKDKNSAFETNKEINDSLNENNKNINNNKIYKSEIEYEKEKKTDNGNYFDILNNNEMGKLSPIKTEMISNKNNANYLSKNKSNKQVESKYKDNVKIMNIINRYEENNNSEKETEELIFDNIENDNKNKYKLKDEKENIFRNENEEKNNELIEKSIETKKSFKSQRSNKSYKSNKEFNLDDSKKFNNNFVKEIIITNDKSQNKNNNEKETETERSKEIKKDNIMNNKYKIEEVNENNYSKERNNFENNEEDKVNIKFNDNGSYYSGENNENNDNRDNENSILIYNKNNKDLEDNCINYNYTNNNDNSYNEEQNEYRFEVSKNSIYNEHEPNENEENEDYVDYENEDYNAYENGLNEESDIQNEKEKLNVENGGLKYTYNEYEVKENKSNNKYLIPNKIMDDIRKDDIQKRKEYGQNNKTFLETMFDVLELASINDKKNKKKKDNGK